MDDNIHKTRSCFLSCFGSVPRKSSFPNKESVKVVKEFKQSKKKSRSLFWSKIKRIKLKNSSTRTVPIDHHHHHHSAVTTTHNLPNSDEINLNHKRRSHRKLLSERKNPLSFHQITPKTVNTATDQEISEEIIEQTMPTPKQTIALENRDPFDHHVDSLKDDTCDKRRNPFNRNIEGKETGFSHPGSPDFKYGAAQTATLAHSVSQPAPNRSSKPRVTTLKKSQLGESIRGNNGVSSTVKKIDSVVGMSIITVTLIMMLLWGRLCAVICTCTWLYFVSRLRVPGDRTVEKNPSSSDGGFLSSEESKKRVVFEGFLERTTRRLGM